MKKSELKKLIRESIKEYLREEEENTPQAPSFCHYCYKQDCWCNSGSGCVNAGNANSPCGQNPPDFIPTGGVANVFDSNGNYVRLTLYKRPTKKLREEEIQNE